MKKKLINLVKLLFFLIPTVVTTVFVTLSELNLLLASFIVAIVPLTSIAILGSEPVKKEKPLTKEELALIQKQNELLQKQSNDAITTSTLASAACMGTYITIISPL